MSNPDSPNQILVNFTRLFEEKQMNVKRNEEGTRLKAKID